MPENAAAGAPKPKNKLMPVIIILLVVVIGFGAYYFFLRPEPEEPAQSTSLYDQLAETVYYSPGDYFVTNISGSQSLCKTSVSLALEDPKGEVTEFLETNNAVVRNAIVKVLISHSEQEMRAMNAMDVLENEMAVAVRSATGLESLQRVFISDFIQ